MVELFFLCFIFYKIKCYKYLKIFRIENCGPGGIVISCIHIIKYLLKVNFVFCVIKFGTPSQLLGEFV